MLKQTLTISAVVALLTVGSMADNEHRGHGRNHGNVQQQGQNCRGNGNFNSTTTQESNVQLSDAQKEGLIFMIEEEKVARDVYLHLAEKWNDRVFSNIAKAEQKHMNAVERLAKRYGVTVPSTLTEEGIFLDERLQKMYNDLIVKGEKSLRDAYLVGVLVEETDIDDLENLLDDETISSSAKQIYSNLLRGSQNHLRAFNRRL